MMAERTTLITARREAEDNLIKTVVQLSVAMIVILTGFITQSELTLSGTFYCLFLSSLVLFGLAIVAGLCEQWLSSKAYEAQQVMVEHYYTKKIAEFETPKETAWVRTAQTTALILFVAALLALTILAAIKASEKYDVEKQTNTLTSSIKAQSATTTEPRPK
ncbi:MAG: hypothetical protein V3V15_03590 [Sphingorhabdus sp.]